MWRSKPLDTGVYTGDVVEELWNGVMIRRHTYSVVQRRIEPPTGAHAYADLAGTTQPQYYRTESEITTENLVDTYTKELPIPDEIKNGRWMAASGNLYQVKATWNKYALVLIDRRYVYGPWVDPQTQLLLNAEKKKISDIKQHLDDTIQVLYKIEGKRVELDENGALERRDEVLQGYDSMRETIYQEVMQAVRALQQNIRPDGPQTRELLTELHATISD